MSDSQFDYLRALSQTVTGIELGNSKKPMLYARLSRRLLELGLNDFDAYIALLDRDQTDELKIFVNRVTTNLTYFFREPNHFSFLKTTALPAIAAGLGARAPMRIWSAGCSTGQEPYSLAITLQSISEGLTTQPRILCTDLNSDVLDYARIGRYAKSELRGLPELQRHRWFRKVAENEYQAMDSLREMLIFRQLNLFDYWPSRPAVDIIFCRNVMIYFDSEAQQQLLHRFTDLLKVGGYLFLGHSESLPYTTDRLERVGTTVYVKCRP